MNRLKQTLVLSGMKMKHYNESKSSSDHNGNEKELLTPTSVLQWTETAQSIHLQSLRCLCRHCLGPFLASTEEQ